MIRRDHDVDVPRIWFKIDGEIRVNPRGRRCGAGSPWAKIMGELIENNTVDAGYRRWCRFDE